MPAKLDPDEAVQVMRAAGAEPREPYRGVDATWPCICVTCGREISPSLGNVKRGQNPCTYCARGGMPLEEAIAFMESRGFTPLEPYRGTHKPWLSRCHSCGTEFGVLLTQIRIGRGCKFCAKRAVDPEVAVKRMEGAGFTPLEPYPGSVTPWLCRCHTCGKESPKSFCNTMSGRGCIWCAGKAPVTEARVRELFLRAGLEPLEGFPGPRGGWKSRCTSCGYVVAPNYQSLRRGGGCRYCAGKAVDPDKARELMRRQGYEPLEPYPGSLKKWRCQCLSCGRESTPTFATTSSKRSRCKFCSPKGIDLTAPGIVYVVTHDELNAHKVGIASMSGKRLRSHQQHGWEVYRTAPLPTAEMAYEVEAAVLRWLRIDLGHGPYLVKEQIPQRGETETVSSDVVSLPDLWRRVQMEVVNVSESMIDP